MEIQTFLRREKNYNDLHTLRKNNITVQYLVGKYDMQECLASFHPIYVP